MGRWSQLIGGNATPEAPNAGHSHHHFPPGVGQYLVEQGAIDQAADHLPHGIDVAVIRGEQRGEVAGGKAGGLTVHPVAVERGSGGRQASHLFPDGREGRLVIRHPHIGAAGLVHMDLGSSDVQGGQLLGLGTLDQGRPGDDHVGTLGHVDPVRDDGHVPTARNAIAKHARDLGDACIRQECVLSEDCPTAPPPGKGP